MRKLSLAVIALAILAAVLLSLTIKIKPGMTGVVNAEWTSGLVEHDYGPGYHWDVGPMHTWTLFDTTVQTLHFNRDVEHAPHGDAVGPLSVKSGDGATVTLDVTIKYRIAEGSVWRVMKEFGPGDRYKTPVGNTARNILRGALGALKTEDFYDPTVRERVAHEMERDLKKQLDQMHISLIAILIRDLTFDAEFEKRIKDKVLSVQEAELKIALTKAADFKGRTQKIEADTESKVIVINQERDKTIVEMRARTQKEVENTRATYQQVVAQTKSDADLYSATKEAEGTKLLKEAEAEGQRLRRDALSGQGANLYVALELARSLNLGSMTFSTQQIDPLDVDAVLRRLGVK
jgi:regulator of protease activity HflC (stomatin/prohibitin superfamily)